MKVMNGKETLFPYTPVTNCTGYIATELVLKARDVSQLVALAEVDPERLKVVLRQLEGRFPEKRLPEPVKPIRIY